MGKLTDKEVADFRRIILTYYRKHGRHTLPWRTSYTTPYHILIAEIMSQQTGIERVIPKFLMFCKSFPTIQTLASAPQSEVLKRWVGLGYNRRAIYLHKAAQEIVTRFAGILPTKPDDLLTLPGIGPYTASSIAAFAHNYPSLVIDTNIRTVFIHHFFQDKENVDDKNLIPFIEQTLNYANPREWYSALMDYGTYLKKTVGNRTRQSKHYTRQSPLAGSRREIRGGIIRLLSDSPMTRAELTRTIKSLYPNNLNDVGQVINDLQKENSIEIDDKRINLK